MRTIRHEDEIASATQAARREAAAAFGDGTLYVERAIEQARHVEVQMISVPADARVLATLHDAGVRRAMHWLPSGPRSAVERGLDRWESAIADFTGA